MSDQGEVDPIATTVEFVMAALIDPSTTTSPVERAHALANGCRKVAEQLIVAAVTLDAVEDDDTEENPPWPPPPPR